jgi:hypothetical protein
MVDYITRDVYAGLTYAKKLAFWNSIITDGFIGVPDDDEIVSNDDDLRGLTTIGRALWWEDFSREYNPDDGRGPRESDGGQASVERPSDGLGEFTLGGDTEEIVFDDDMEVETDGLGEFTLGGDTEEIVFYEEEEAGQDEEGTTTGQDDLVLPSLPPVKVPCKRLCAKRARERERKCHILRRRVALALKKAGCPSRVS